MPMNRCLVSRAGARWMRFVAAGALAGGLSTFAAGAAAHIRLDYPPPRSMGSEVGPCGDAGTTRSATPTVLRGGDEITVTWSEVIDHPSHYRIALLLDGEAFPEPANTSDRCDPSVDEWCIADGLPDESGSMQSYSHTFTLPNVDCDSCTLQVIQNTFVRYFQCADITIVAQGDDTEDPGDPGEVDGSGGAAPGAGGGSAGGSGGGTGGLTEPATGGAEGHADHHEEHGDPGEGAPSAASGEGSGCSLVHGAPPGAPWALLGPLLWGLRRSAARRGR